MAEAVTEARDDREALHWQVRATLTRLSRTGSLPVLPGVATAALAIARDPNSDVDDLTNVIQSDVGITARLVRVANSAGYGRQRRAQSIREAVITVGLRQACSILVAVCARQLYAAPGPYTEVLWNHSLAVALAAEELARVTRLVKVDAVFLPGLFHDVGRIAFQLADAHSFLVIQRLVEAGDGPSTTLEREWYQFDHAQVSAMLSEDWGLGLDQCDAIRWHHDPTRADTGRGIASVLNAADSLAYSIGCGTYPEPPSDVSMRPLGLSADDEAVCADRVRQAFEMQRLLIG